MYTERIANKLAESIDEFQNIQTGLNQFSIEEVEEFLIEAERKNKKLVFEEVDDIGSDQIVAKFV